MLLILTGTGKGRPLQPDVAYDAGYSACANEALRHISELEHVSLATRHRLMEDLSDHLRRRTVAADDDVTAMTSPAACDVTVVPRRRLFDGTSTRSQRRPLADIQPTVSRDPPTVSRSKTAAAFATTDCLRFPFPVDVGHVMSSDVPSSLSTELMSRCVTLTQTMTTTLQQQQQTSTDRDVINVRQEAPSDWQESNRRCDVDANDSLRPMWRPW